jgi:hypothetical protein
MRETIYRKRRACRIENDRLRVTVLVEGGHIAEILDQDTGVNPLWLPPWRSIEPSTYDCARHPEYGANAESKLLAGLMGHNLCLDFFGGPSDEEAAAGLTVHGEAAVAPFEISGSDCELTMSTVLPVAQLRFERRLRLDAGSDVLRFEETVENLSPADRPVGWTEHVTLGPPFLEAGNTQFSASATLSKVDEYDGGTWDLLETAAQFSWPHAPLRGGGTLDLRIAPNAPASTFSTHLMDPGRERAFFAAFSPSQHALFGYAWNRRDFPWLAIWDEHHSRETPPWNGETFARGMEFGVSPMAESRRQMIDRGRLFDTPCFRWIPARGKVRVEYCAFLRRAEAMPQEMAEVLPPA